MVDLWSWPAKSGRLDQDVSLWARKKLVARPDFESRPGTRSGPGDPDQIYSGPDRVFLVQIENRPGPEKIRPGPEKIRPGPGAKFFRFFGDQDQVYDPDQDLCPGDGSWSGS